MKLGVALWLVAVFTGFGFLMNYGGDAGERANPPNRWPAHSELGQGAHGTLLLFLHPQCPCSRATLSELARLVAQTAVPLEGTVVLYSPDGVERDWVESDLWESANRIPGLQVKHDRNGREADIFAARTSGQVLWYNNSGDLGFSGGLTPSRGHEGESPGKLALLSLLSSETPAQVESSVYGCSLKERECLETECSHD